MNLFYSLSAILTTLTAAIKFDMDAFLKQLKTNFDNNFGDGVTLLVLGMVGILVVMVILIIAITVLNKVTKEKPEDQDKQD